jgi:hypothetical protein
MLAPRHRMPWLLPFLLECCLHMVAAALPAMQVMLLSRLRGQAHGQALTSAGSAMVACASASRQIVLCRLALQAKYLQGVACGRAVRIPVVPLA